MRQTAVGINTKMKQKLILLLLLIISILTIVLSEFIFNDTIEFFKKMEKKNYDL